MPQPLDATAHVGQLFLNSLQPLPLLAGDPVHLFVHQPHQFLDVALCKDALPYLIDDESLEPLRVEPRCVARPPALLQERLAHVVGELSSLGILSSKSLSAFPALDQSAEEIGARGSPGMGVRRRSGVQQR